MAYQTLCTEFYNITKPVASEQELDLYAHLLSKIKGPILEAMCGSGRLMIPLLKKGIVLEGVDNSAPMLDSCRERCAKEGLNPILHHQSIVELSLKKKYAAIIIAVGSFQLIHDRKTALATLKTLRDHLLPGGSLLLDTDVPYDVIASALQEPVISGESRVVTSSRTIACDNRSYIRLTNADTVHLTEQYYAARVTYDKFRDNVLVETEREEHSIRWYYRYEMELLLEKAGFQKIALYDISFDLNPNGVLYCAQL